MFSASGSAMTVLVFFPRATYNKRQNEDQNMET